MSISLVSITHPIDPHSDVPFVGGRAPLMNVSVETWKVRHIEAMGFGVEIHAEPYDPVAVSNAKAAELAVALGQPVVVATPAKKAAPPAKVALAPIPEIVAPMEPVQEELPATETAAEGEPEQVAGDEEVTMTEDEVLALRARVEALSTVNDAKALIAEYGIELNPMPVKLKDIKAQLIAMIDAPAE
jgi:hypothetical protein